MNATDTIAPAAELSPLEPALLSDPNAPDSTATPTPLPTSDETQPRHRKIANLPKPLRDLINSMLDDGRPGHEIVAKLQASSDPPLPYPVSNKNISDWRNTGYLRYLAQQERLALFQANREGASDLVATGEITALPEATLQIVANQFYEFLGDFSADALKEKLSEDPLKYTRFLNVFARLVREMVYLRKFRDAAAKATAAKLKQLDSERDLSDNEFDAIVGKMDRVFKVARPRRHGSESSASSRADAAGPHSESGGSPQFSALSDVKASA